jgi:hypothetical protein
MKTSKMQIRTRQEYNKYIIRTSTLPTGIDGPTPFILVEDIINNMDKVDWSNPNLKILDPAFGFGTFLFVCYLKLIEFHSEAHILNNMLYGIEIEPFRYTLVKTKFAIKNLYLGDFLNPSDEIKRMLNMVKFDVIVGNPPYQKKVGPTKTEPIWDKFVLKSFQLLKEGGYLSMVHPSGWRNVSGRFTGVRDLLLSKQMEYLEIHNEADGIEMFGAKTRYDWYTVQNVDRYKNTTVRFEEGTIEEIDLGELPFIPNHSYDRIKSLIAKEGEERVTVLHSKSAYETRKPYISKTKTQEFKYPVIQSVRMDNSKVLRWSSKKDVGHFGIPKFVFCQVRIGSSETFIDINGEYGLTQFACAIVDSPENLVNIKKAYESEEFHNLMLAMATTGFPPYKHFELFRKDFWKEFV